MEHHIRIFVAINFLIIGGSHILHSGLWNQFFIRLRELGKTGSFIHGLITLFGGSLIISFHNIWVWPEVIISLTGWVYLIKAAIVFLLPDTGYRSLSMAKEGQEKNFVIAGVVMFLVGVVSLCCLFR